LIPSARH